MSPYPVRTLVLAAMALLVGACASRPPTPPLARYDPAYGYRATNWQAERGDPDFGLVIAMSGGGTRAAALSSTEVLETKRDPPALPGRQ